MANREGSGWAAVVGWHSGWLAVWVGQTLPPAATSGRGQGRPPVPCRCERREEFPGPPGGRSGAGDGQGHTQCLCRSVKRWPAQDRVTGDRPIENRITGGRPVENRVTRGRPVSGSPPGGRSMSGSPLGSTPPPPPRSAMRGAEGNSEFHTKPVACGTLFVTRAAARRTAAHAGSEGLWRGMDRAWDG